VEAKVDGKRFPWSTQTMSVEPDGQALDGCDVRLLTRNPFSSAIHCELPANATSRTTMNNWIHEIWFFVSGCGVVWRSNGTLEQEVEVEVGVSITIPPQVAFQYRSTSDDPLVFLVFGAPAFPGPEANELVPGREALGSPTFEPGLGAGPGRITPR